MPGDVSNRDAALLWEKQKKEIVSDFLDTLPFFIKRRSCMITQISVNPYGQPKRSYAEIETGMWFATCGCGPGRRPNRILRCDSQYSGP